MVTFESEALFRGQFVASYSGTNLQASVTCPDKPSTTYAINLLRSDSTYDQPRQTWQFTSDLVVSVLQIPLPKNNNNNNNKNE